MEVRYGANQRIPVKMWIPPENIEDSAWDQILNLSILPFAFKHIAIMPDVHAGYGMPIGGVMATQGVVVPNAVGVDIGCTDMDTEYLSPKGWKKISDYPNTADMVMQFDPTTGYGEFVHPTAYIKEKCDRFIHIKTKYGIDQMLSEDHRCLMYKYDRSYSFEKYEVVTASELMSKHNSLKLGVRDKFKTSINLRLPPYQMVDLTEDQLRVMVMTSADGSLNHGSCYLRLKKERKIHRAVILLDLAAINYSVKLRKDGVTVIRFIPPIYKKGLDQFWGASKYQLGIIADEAIHWDGNQKDQVFYTRNKKEADFIQYANMSIGYRTSLIDDKRKGEIDYRLFRFEGDKVGISGTPKTKMKYVKSKDGFKYCFTVPSSFLVLRRNGYVFITGNCGMAAVKTSLTELSTENLKKIMGSIRNRIPVGFNHNKTPALWEGFSRVPFVPEVRDEVASASYQLGTLGGGNHFIEIQKGSDGFIWYMIHSGSRNFGLKIAKHYHWLAKTMCERFYSNIPHSDLSFLPLDPEFGGMEYLESMNFALEFAKENRRRMCVTIMDTIIAHIPDASFETLIDVHHNYARMENHYGQNVLVHRKGATSAREGEIGIIPGSQGTKSYIVKGLGNPESFMSCSHGAGRKMGRKDAQRNLNLQEEQKKLDDLGILHAIRGMDDLDEASGAYKDISVVMENQKELVEIVTELTPMGVVKG